MEDSEDNVARRGSVEASIGALAAASKLSPRLRTVNISDLTNEICSESYENGFDVSNLEAIVNLVTVKSELDQTSVATLIKHLFPAGSVPNSVVLTIVGCLGQGQLKPTPSAQALLVRWLSNVYSCMVEPSMLSKVYGVLFGLLDMISLRAALCHLLALITRRRSGVSLKADAEWRTRLVVIQNANLGQVQQHSYSNGFKIKRHMHVKNVPSVVPRVHTLRAFESSVTLEEVDSMEDLIDGLEKIEPPSQLASVVGDSLLHKYLLLKPKEATTNRLELWLARCFDEILEEASYEENKSGAFEKELLEALLVYAKINKTLLPVIEDFLRNLLRERGGTSHIPILLSLLTFLRPQDFGETPAMLRDPGALERLVDFYTVLLRRWTVIRSHDPTSSIVDERIIRELSRHVSTLHVSALASSAAESSVLRYYEQLPSLFRSWDSSSGQAPLLILPPPQTVYLLGFSFALDNLSRICAILATYKVAFEEGIKASVRFPSETTARFNGYLMDFCNLLWRSRAFTTADTNSAGCLCPEALVASLRTYVAAVDPEYSISAMFGLPHNALICALSLKVLQESEDEAAASGMPELARHVGPASQRTLAALTKEGGLTISWKEYRVQVLQWLGRNGIGGIMELMFVTMKDLMK
ncbi:Mis6-domain-containing protein [Rhizodiscina lignyota]|uniref:Mis6-domain-containing protein n=1 Tax=Rhizodiscina lignyota TaxID=1504668 RepID=A0A9P4ID22_9PEZI|nr:Mis6-domain-containing protein [Rhizodiscina lignyota]